MKRKKYKWKKTHLHITYMVTLQTVHMVVVIPTRKYALSIGNSCTNSKTTRRKE